MTRARAYMSQKSSPATSREAEAVDHVGFAVVAHARAAIGVGRGPMVPGGPRSTAIAPASMNHCAILSWMKAPSFFWLSLLSGRALGDARGAVATRGLAHDLEALLTNAADTKNR
jgi:hypothetical protein